MSKYTQIVVLCEDTQQWLFAYYFLIGWGIPRQRIRRSKYSFGSGSGEQRVRVNYPKEVRELRRYQHHLNICLIVIMDADTQSIENHFRELENALATTALERRYENEKIAIFIPKRNIETWIVYLKGDMVNENDEYPHLRKNESDCKPSVTQLAENCRNRQPLPDNAPPSLKAACKELERIL